METVDLCC